MGVGQGLETTSSCRWKRWARRLTTYFGHLERLFSPELFIIGGGVGRHHDKYFDMIEVPTPLVPARMLNRAGIVGALHGRQGQPRRRGATGDEHGLDSDDEALEAGPRGPPRVWGIQIEIARVLRVDLQTGDLIRVAVRNGETALGRLGDADVVGRRLDQARRAGVGRLDHQPRLASVRRQVDHLVPQLPARLVAAPSCWNTVVVVAPASTRAEHVGAGGFEVDGRAGAKGS